MLFTPNTHTYPYCISNVDRFLLSLGIIIDKNPAVIWCSRELILICWTLVDLEVVVHVKERRYQPSLLWSLR